MRTTLNNMLKLSGLAVFAFLSAQCTPEDLGPAAPTQFDLPDLVVKPVDFAGTKSIISEEGALQFDEMDDLQVFVEDTDGASVAWEDVSYKYISADAPNNIFKPETPAVLEKLDGRYNLYVMSPYSEAVIDPIGGEQSSTAFTFDGQIQDCKNLRAHLTAYDIMTGCVKNVIAGQRPEIQMEHKSAMVHFSIQNSLRRPVTIQSVELTAPEGVLIGGAYSIEFKNGGSLTSITGTNTSLLYLDNAPVLNEDDFFDVYFMTPYFTLLAGDELKLHVISDNGEWDHIFTMETDREFLPGQLNEAVALRPQYTVDRLWSKTASDFGFLDPRIAGVAMNDNFIAINQWGGDLSKDQFMLVNREDGTVANAMPTFTTFTTKVRSDAAGHFIVNRENVYGAGFVASLYEEEHGTFKTLLNYAHVKDVTPVDLGYNMNVCGDFTAGKAYVYGMAPLDTKIYAWELNDGVLVTPQNTPMILDCSKQLGGEKWFRANLQRVSVAEDSPYYFSCFIKKDDKNQGGSLFGIASPTFEMTMMNPENFMYKILDFKVAEFGDKKILVTLEQTYENIGPSFIKIYDISDPAKMQTMKPGDEGYNKFLLYTSDPYVTANYNAWGSVDLDVKPFDGGHVITIVTGLIGENTLQSFVDLYKMVYYDKE